MKLFSNTNPESQNKIISRSLLKIAAVDREWLETATETPKHGEFWLCDILKETAQGRGLKGLFIVKPIKPIPVVDKSPQIVHLIPGMYTEEVLDTGVVVVTPHRQDRNWVMPLHHKSLLAELRGAHAVVVNLGGDLWPLKRVRPPGKVINDDKDISTDE